ATIFWATFLTAGWKHLQRHNSETSASKRSDGNAARRAELAVLCRRDPTENEVNRFVNAV
ncbi:MAG TPA: hypothetical protein VEA60_03195, partial [Allosphingosinicella sp.]|nr:hypothetical protein [Allosphingosinicella sp.]